MNAASIDIKSILVADSSLGLIFGTNLFIGKEPTSPLDCVTIFDTTGFGPEFTLDKQSLFNPSIQIRVRSISYETGYAWIESIATALHLRAHEVWGGTQYELISIASGPALLDYDDRGNPRFIINFNIIRRN